MRLSLTLLCEPFQVQIHEPILVAPEGPELRSDFESSFAEFAKAGVAINLVTYYDDVGSAYPWVVKLPVSPYLRQCIHLHLSALWYYHLWTAASCADWLGALRVH